MPLNANNPWILLVGFLVLVISIGVHEFAHVLSAYLQGDTTGKAMGRLTLNPLKHLDPYGTLLMVVSMLSGFGLGWGKPAPFNPYSLRFRRWGPALVAVAGPVANLVLVLLAGYAYVFLSASLGPLNLLSIFLLLLVVVNASLAIFNILPIHPLDGSHLLEAALGSNHPIPAFFQRYGMIILLGLIFFGRGLLGTIITGGIDLILTAFGLRGIFGSG